MLPYTNTIKGKIVIYTYLSLLVFVGVLVLMMTKMGFDGLKANAETILRLEVGEVAETLNRFNLEAVTTAKALAQAQESEQIYGKRNRSIHLLHHVLKENQDYTGIYYCFEPDADGNDANYLQRDNAYLDAVDSTGRFLPTWIRSLTNPDSIYLTSAKHMHNSLYYQGLKVRVTSSYQENYIPPELEISGYYRPGLDHYIYNSDQRFMITEPYRYEGKYMVEYTYPIVVDGLFKGIAGVDRTLDSYNSYVQRVRRSWSEDLIVVSRLGRVVATTLDGISTAEPFDSSPYGDIIRQIYTRVLNDSTLVVEGRDPANGKSYYYTGLKINMGQWLVISRVSVDEILAPIRAQIAISIIVAIMGMAALLPLLIWIANSISQPVEQARDIANEISSGNFDVSIPPHSAATDTGKVLAAMGELATSVRELLSLKQLAASLSGRYVNATAENISDVITRTLEDTSRSIGADRAYVLIYNAEAEEIVYTHVWNAADAPAAVELNRPYPKSLIGYTIEQLARGSVLTVDNVESLPESAAAERDFYIRNGLRSYVTTPLMSADGLSGALLFVSMHQTRTWERKHIELLEIIGNVTINALNRIDREEELARLNAELERRVEQRTEQLRDANRELEAFSYSVSHDLRTPLRHIDGFTDLLRQRIDPKLDDRDREYLEKIAGASRHMGRLIDDLLLFSRMARIELIKTTFNVVDMAREVVEELSPDYTGRTIEFSYGDVPPVYGDPSMVRMVLVNLLSNAIKFTAPRDIARITLAGSTQDGMTTIAVRDNGVGFDPEYTHKLFGVFERLHSQSDFEGTGIGLANVRRIIHRHGGTVAAVGKPDIGAEFLFTIPASPEGLDDTVT